MYEQFQYLYRNNVPLFYWVQFRIHDTTKVPVVLGLEKASTLVCSVLYFGNKIVAEDDCSDVWMGQYTDEGQQKDRVEQPWKYGEECECIVEDECWEVTDMGLVTKCPIEEWAKKQYTREEYPLSELGYRSKAELLLEYYKHRDEIGYQVAVKIRAEDIK